MELWTQDRSHAHHDYVPIHPWHLGVMHAQPRKASSTVTHSGQSHLSSNFILIILIKFVFVGDRNPSSVTPRMEVRSKDSVFHYISTLKQRCWERKRDKPHRHLKHWENKTKTSRWKELKEFLDTETLPNFFLQRIFWISPFSVRILFPIHPPTRGLLFLSATSCQIPSLPLIALPLPRPSDDHPLSYFLALTPFFPAVLPRNPSNCFMSL